MKKRIELSLLVASSLFADAQMDAIKEQLQQQQEATKKLESKLNTIEQNKKNYSASFSQNAYLPDMALILNMSALSRNVENSDYADAAMPGFIDSGDMHLPFNKERGFNLNYAEVVMHSEIESYFEAFALFHLHPDVFEIGEAYVKTTSMPYGLEMKAGKFKSNFGYINAKHHDTWDFDTQAIIYKSLFGPEGMSDPGIQVQWTVPGNTYAMCGLEAIQGSNERSFG